MDFIGVITIFILICFFAGLFIYGYYMYPVFMVSWAKKNYNSILQKQDKAFTESTEYKPPPIS